MCVAGGNRPGRTQTINRLLERARQNIKKNKEETGLKLAMEARKMAVDQGETEKEAEACRFLAETWFDRDGNKALSFYNEEIHCRVKMGDKTGLAYCYNASGILLKRKGLYYDSLMDYYKSLRIAETIPDTKNRLRKISSAAYNIASLYDTFHFYHKSIHYYLLSLKCERQLNSRDGQYLVMSNMGITYRKLKEYGKAVSYTREALKFAKETGNTGEVIRITNNLAYFYLKAGKIKKSLALHQEALRLARTNHINEMLPYIYSGLGEIYFKLGKFKKALQNQKTALKLSKDDELRMLIYRNLTDVGLALHNLTDSTKYFQKYEKLMDKYYSPANFAKFETLMNAFEQDENDRQIQLLIKEKKIQRLWKNMLLTGLIAVLIFLLWMISRYRLKQQMNRELDQLARHDPLTGLSNRRDILEKLNIEYARCVRNQDSLTLCICDIDFFKSVNDSYGHQAGDYVLTRLAEIFRENLRETDISGRWGGEEFILVFSETDLTGAVDTVKKLKHRISETPFRFSGNKINVTLTFGIAQCNIGVSIDTCIRRADEALYRGKAAGRNQIVTA
ncbi:MAG: GGDEF domain-containing protein [Acidobacteria bacterium]|nr:GGDEF domain-containing protein [Acidobacteriota bacterium]